MFERFTDRARKVLAIANQEAQRYNQEFIATEHILLGIIKEGSGVAAGVLKNLEVDLRKVRVEVEKLIPPGSGTTAVGKLAQTPQAKNVIRFAVDEARRRNHNYVGTEHVLLGLLDATEGVAARVLAGLNVDLERVRKEIYDLFGHGDPSGELRASTESRPPIPAASRAQERFWNVLLNVGRAMIILSLPIILILSFLLIVLEWEPEWINAQLIMAASMMTFLLGCIVYFAAKLSAWCARGNQ